MTYKGPDRSELRGVRKTIERAEPVQRSQLVSMARQLGPDMLRETDAEIGRHYKQAQEAAAGKRHDINPRKEACIERFRMTPPSELPVHVLDWQLENQFALSEETKASLEAAGVKTVRDFVLASKKELAEAKGMSVAAMDEISRVLLSGWGIRSV